MGRGFVKKAAFFLIKNFQPCNHPTRWAIVEKNIDFIGVFYQEWACVAAYCGADETRLESLKSGQPSDGGRNDGGESAKDQTDLLRRPPPVLCKYS
jgi:hypothetical protein